MDASFRQLLAGKLGPRGPRSPFQSITSFLSPVGNRKLIRTSLRCFPFRVSGSQSLSIPVPPSLTAPPLSLLECVSAASSPEQLIQGFGQTAWAHLSSLWGHGCMCIHLDVAKVMLMDPGGDPDMTGGTVGTTGLFTAELTSCPTLLAFPGAREK